MKKKKSYSLMTFAASTLLFAACTKESSFDKNLADGNGIVTAAATAAPSQINSVFLSMGNSTNGAWGLNTAGMQVASERNYDPSGNVIDRIVNPQIVGSPNNLPYDLLNFSAIGGLPNWFGGRHTLGAGDDYISGSESLTVELGASLASKVAQSAKMNLTGDQGATTATVQPLLNGNPVGSPLTIALGNAQDIVATGGARFNGLRISATTGRVAIVGTPTRPRQAVWFFLTDAGPTPPVVENGFTATGTTGANLATARWRNFRSGNNAWDIAVGQGIPNTPANYSTLDFDDFYVYGPTNKNVFTFSYNPTSGDQTLSVKVGSTVNSATKNLGNLGTLNYLQLSLQANTTPSSEVQFKNVVLTVGGIDYPLGNFSRSGATQDWQIRNFDLTAGFTITGDAYLIGQATGDESNVINIRVGKRTY